MNITRCPAGHFYDRDEYDRCPHCDGRTEEKKSPRKPEQPAAGQEKKPKRISVMAVFGRKKAATPEGAANGLWAFAVIVPVTGFLLSLVNWYFIRVYTDFLRRADSQERFYAELSGYYAILRAIPYPSQPRRGSTSS